MDPEFPFLLPAEPELLVLAYAADRDKVLEAFREACLENAHRIARRLEGVFELTGAEVRAHDNRILRLACGGGHLELARWLVDHFGLTAADARAGRDSSSYTPLQLASARDRLEVARWLAGHFRLTETDAHLTHSYGFRAACANGHFGSAYWLAGYFGPAAGAEYLTAFADACRGHPGTARWLAHFRPAAADVRAGHNRALHAAFGDGGLGVARWLIEHYRLAAGDVRWDDNRLICAVCSRGDLGQASWLIASFDLSDAPGDGALAMACGEPHPGLARWLSGRFGLVAADMHAGGNSALRRAIIFGCVRTVRWLVAVFGLAVDDEPKDGDPSSIHAYTRTLGVVCWLASWPGRAVEGEWGGWRPLYYGSNPMIARWLDLRFVEVRPSPQRLRRQKMRRYLASAGAQPTNNSESVCPAAANRRPNTLPSELHARATELPVPAVPPTITQGTTSPTRVVQGRKACASSFGTTSHLPAPEAQSSASPSSPSSVAPKATPNCPVHTSRASRNINCNCLRSKGPSSIGPL